jgi:hypothetical protein
MPVAHEFVVRDNAARLEKVMGYTGCRELWLQAELALWLEHRGRLPCDGEWDTNLLIAGPGRCDLAVRGGNGGLDLAFELKVLGGDYQAKVLTGSAGALERFMAMLRQRDWRVELPDLVPFESIGTFSLLADYRRLRSLDQAREKLLVVVVDNRRSANTELGEALARIELPSKATRSEDIAPGLRVRLWQL